MINDETSLKLKFKCISSVPPKKMNLMTMPNLFMVLLGIFPLNQFEGKLRIFYRIYRTFNAGFYSVFIVLLNLQLCFLVITNQKPTRISASAALVITLFFAVIKIIIYNKNKVPSMCVSIAVAENDILRSDDEEIRDMYSTTLKYGLILNISLIFSTGTTVFTFVIVPFFELWKVGIKGWNFDEKSFMYDLYFPFNKTAFFPLVIAWNVYSAFLSLLVNSISHAMFLSLVVFNVSQLRMLQIRIRKFHTYAKNGDYLLTISGFIQEHQKQIRVIKDLNMFANYIMLFEFLLSSANLASIMFQIITTSKLIDLTFPLIFLLLIAIEVFFVGWTANQIKEQSLAVADAIYESPWYEQKETVKKLLLLMIMRAQRPLALTIGPFTPMTTETVITIAKASYSYVALMKKNYDGNK